MTNLWLVILNIYFYLKTKIAHHTDYLIILFYLASIMNVYSIGLLDTNFINLLYILEHYEIKIYINQTYFQYLNPTLQFEIENKRKSGRLA